MEAVIAAASQIVVSSAVKSLHEYFNATLKDIDGIDSSLMKSCLDRLTKLMTDRSKRVSSDDSAKIDRIRKKLERLRPTVHQFHSSSPVFTFLILLTRQFFILAEEKYARV
jgi:hypothetical protein